MESDSHQIEIWGKFTIYPNIFNLVVLSPNGEMVTNGTHPSHYP